MRPESHLNQSQISIKSNSKQKFKLWLSSSPSQNMAILQGQGEVIKNLSLFTDAKDVELTSVTSSKKSFSLEQELKLSNQDSTVTENRIFDQIDIDKAKVKVNVGSYKRKFELTFIGINNRGLLLSGQRSINMLPKLTFEVILPPTCLVGEEVMLNVIGVNMFQKVKKVKVSLETQGMMQFGELPQDGLKVSY